MEWNRLLSTKRARESYLGARKSTDLRSEFEKDYHRIIGSASFRRLQDKTQVFPLDKSDFIRTRLTHSLEVSSLATSLGQNIGENILKYQKDSGFTAEMKEDICNILKCAGLIHDIGNPPFGHFGEVEIREWFQRNLKKLKFKETPVADILTEQMRADFYHFEGNAQALRLVTKLHYLVDENGMNLTYALLNTMIKYPGSSVEMDPNSDNQKDKKMGYYYADTAIFEEIVETTGAGHNRHPLTYILEAADDLAYKTADIEDAFVKGYISYQMLEDALTELVQRYGSDGCNPLEKLQEYYHRGKEKGVRDPESYAIKNWIVQIQGFLINCATYGFHHHYDAIMEGTYGQDLFYETKGEHLMELLGTMAYEEVFCSQDIYKMEIIESVMIDYLLEQFIGAVLYYDTEVELGTKDKRLISFISDNYRSAYRRQAEGKDETEKLYLRLLLVTDFICGMTDSYAKRLYQEMKAII